jgi:AAA+ superfamily predicted ATPase
MDDVNTLPEKLAHAKLGGCQQKTNWRAGMDETTEKENDLVQLARLALSGRPQDVQTYVTRLSRKYLKLAPELGRQLKELIKLSPTRQSPLRSEGVANIPVDRDSRLQLLRHEQQGALPHDPIWSNSISDQLNQVVSEHKRSDELLIKGLAPTRTAIFTGPPGVGKTMAARWLAAQLDRPLLILDLSAVISSFLGRTGTNVRHVLDYAKGVSCVLLLDELDAIAKRRDDAQEVGELKRLVTVLLQEIDDWPEGGLLIAASNHPELLDPAVWRRFEMQIKFELPESSAIEQAVKLFLDDSTSLSRAWTTALAEVMCGHSFSDIERELKGLRRQAILRNCSIEDLFPNLVRQHIDGQSKSEKKEIAVRLTEAGLSQRSVNELTGVSRDTIRKLNREGETHSDQR